MEFNSSVILQLLLNRLLDFQGYRVVVRFTDSVHKVNIWIMDRPTNGLLVPSAHTIPMLPGFRSDIFDSCVTKYPFSRSKLANSKCILKDLVD
ncbi:hypothetical protein H5410_008266 [Solanum commersonii]|uniref:Uncharacterized protein n=1 Tax=Solanum commersonii TaxID=4109 RepID=A0A9J6AEP8_SOLCO|nr:hypothetical protein H5410_008266 [Solanum commersonii]